MSEKNTIFELKRRIFIKNFPLKNIFLTTLEICSKFQKFFWPPFTQNFFGRVEAPPAIFIHGRVWHNDRKNLLSMFFRALLSWGKLLLHSADTKKDSPELLFFFARKMFVILFTFYVIQNFILSISTFHLLVHGTWEYFWLSD